MRVCVGVVVLGAVTCASPACEELFELGSANDAAGAAVGKAVDMAGDTVIVGAPKHPPAGAVFIFDAQTGEHAGTLHADDLALGSRFGRAVSLRGTSALIGAPPGAGQEIIGAAYIFDTATGEQLIKLTALEPSTSDSFGVSVALSDSVAVVGASCDDEHGDQAGAAYVFDRATGDQLFKLFPANGDEDDRFGADVAIEGDIALIGAFGADPYGVKTGAAYLFDLNTGEQLAVFADADGGAIDGFGFSVAISGTTALIGAIRDDDAAFDAGSVYLFDLFTADPVGKLLSGDPVYQERFGYDVSVAGGTVLVGAPLPHLGQPGAAYLFDLTTGAQTGKLQVGAGAPNDAFGVSVALHGSTALAGASGVDGAAGQNSGSAYLFSTASCAADVDHDCHIGVDDLIAVILGWGTEAGDANGDGTTDCADLTAVVAAWGTCE